MTPKPCELVNVPDVHGFKGKKTEGTEKNPFPSKICIGVPVLKPKCKESTIVYPFLVSVTPEMVTPDYTIFSDSNENKVVSVTPKPC